MHGFAACRPRHERIREPRLRVRQVLRDESRSCGDWSNEISHGGVGLKSVAQPKRTLPSRRPVETRHYSSTRFAGWSWVTSANILNFQSISYQRSRSCSAYRDFFGNAKLQTIEITNPLETLPLCPISRPKGTVDLERCAIHRDDPRGQGG
jgi:hypothetical protein